MNIEIVREPVRIELLGTAAQKLIDEHVGRRATGDDRVSVARIKSPEGWAERGQVPEFDEYFLVLSGTLRVSFRDGSVDVGPNQTILARAGEWVQHGTPYPGGAEYIAVCLPSYAPERVHPDGERPAGRRAGLAPEEIERLRAFDRDHMWHSWSPIDAEPRIFVEGSGCYLTDAEGKRYLDARSSSFNTGLGYGRADVAAAISEQLRKLMTYDIVDASTEPPLRLAGRLAGLVPPPLTRCFFCTGGSEAIETAIKLTRIYHGLRGRPEKTVLLGYKGGYHGPTLGAMGLYGSVFHQTGCGPMPTDFGTIPHPAAVTGAPMTAGEGIAAVERAIGEAGGPARVGAIFLEPIQGNGGVRIPPDGYLAQLRRLCDRHDILLVFDEIMTGCGRTGRLFALEHWDVVPDILLLSKCLSGGYMPLSVLVTRDDIHDTFREDPLLGGFRHGFTNSGHAAACAAGLAVLDVIERENLVENARAQGEVILQRLRELATGMPAILDVRGLGLLIGFELAKDEAGESRAARVTARAAELGLLLRRAGEVLIIAPPLILDGEDREALLGMLERALEESV
jgi:adenosylmethionine-8-amino-7-oxononanoate aminotransferase/mannose-6-phosphate isomerase-like protein (cupin superfamily)